MHPRACARDQYNFCTDQLDDMRMSDRRQRVVPSGQAQYAQNFPKATPSRAHQNRRLHFLFEKRPQNLEGL
jgi:hypothetical protein